MHYFIFCSLLFMPVLHAASAIEKTPVEIVNMESLGIKDPKLIIDYQLASIDRLVQMTAHTIDNLNDLRRLIDDYKLKQEGYLERPESKEKLYRMSKVADQILTQSKADHLQDALDPEFLKEISMLAQIYRKLSLPTEP